MAVSSKDARSTRSGSGAWLHPLVRRLYVAAHGVTLILAAAALYALVGAAIEWGRVALDDVRYGRPRTVQMTGYVGHNEAAGRPSHFMAINLDRQVVVVQLPGGDAAQARTFTGPYLFGANEHLTPVTLSLADMDGDGQADLLLNVRQEQIVYLNREGAFRLPTPEEQARLVLEHNQ